MIRAGGYAPEGDPLFYACFKCPLSKETPPKDCNWVLGNGECLFRIKWGVAKGIIGEKEANLLLEKREKLRRKRWKQIKNQNMNP